MMIEDKSTYAYQLRHLANPSFDKIRNLAKDFIMKLSEQLKDELYEEIERGEKQLETEPELMYYLHAFGKMHKAKLNYAFEHLPETFFEIPELNIIDYGCGQAVATMCYADFLRKQGYEQKIRRVTLIEPSEAALKRAALHVSVFFPDAEIVTINKEFDDLETKDIVCDEDVPTLHLLSNVLDLECFSLIAFNKLVKKRIGPSNLFVCVGPYFGDKDRGKHMDSFAKYFKGEEIFSEDLDAYELDEDNSWTCMVRCFKMGDLEHSIPDEFLSTEVTNEDIEDGIKDEYGVIYSKDGKRLLSAKHIDCKTYTINKGIKVICDQAFVFCESLQSIVIPNSVTKIGDGAFSHCLSLQSIVIPNGVTNIGNSAFLCCESLQSISIPNSVKSIGNDAFLGCHSLQSLIIPNGVTNIGNGAFTRCKSLQSIVIPESVTSIGNMAFNSCESLQSIVIPESVTSIGANPFVDSGVRSIVCHSKFFTVDRKALYDQKKKLLIACFSKGYHFVIPDNVTSIGDSAFSWCKSLQSIVIPNSVTSIGDWAFASCESLQSIVIPNSVKSIGNLAFLWCESLQSIVIPDSVTSIGDFAFKGCKSLQSIVIPKSVTRIGKLPFGDSGIGSILSHSKFFKVDGKAMYDHKKKLLIAFYSKDTRFVVPDSVTSIGNGAFFRCKSLQSIVVPNGVTSIGDSAFADCASLQSIVIPNSVKSIGNRAFLCCKSLQSIVIPNSATSIGEYAFNGCFSLQSIIIPKGRRAKFKKMLDEELWDKLVEE